MLTSDNLYVGQVPLEPLRVTVTDSGDTPLDLTAYSTVVPVMADPHGVLVDLTDGAVLVSVSEVGVYEYVWPTGSLFPEVGDYSWQTTLVSPGVLDITETSTIEVHPTLESVAP